MESATTTSKEVPTPMQSPGIAIEFCTDLGKPETNDRPKPSPHATLSHHELHHALHHALTSPEISTEGWRSPARHHRRTPSQHREIKETTDARTEYTNDDVDGRSQHCINQYRIIEEIGRGSYGSVHLAVDHYGKEFAVKEFSKTRLRRRAQSLIMRRPGPGPRRPIRRAATSMEEPKDSLHFIRQEIAIMKKLNHDNLVQLIEVLDDPEQDSLYMVLEMCKKGPVMKIEVNQWTQPLDEEKARCCFRDLLLGIEYLHGQNICHRDIKPDNLLMTDDDVLKIVDFGVSEMFAKPNNMRTSKNAGSPAFTPPELCGRHADVSGTAADIWSMGVCLYCFKYGHLPFEYDNVVDMYESIQNDPLKIPEREDPIFRDLITRLLDKNPESRINMVELREHSWVTRNGEDTLLPAEENCRDIVEHPNPIELNHALTRKISDLVFVMKAIRKFLGLLDQAKERKRLSSHLYIQSDNGDDANLAIAESLVQARRQFLSTQKRNTRVLPSLPLHTISRLGIDNGLEGRYDKSNTVFPKDKKAFFLGIGTGGHDGFEALETAEDAFVSDSPTGVDDEFNIYDRAFEEKLEHLKRTSNAKQCQNKLFLNRLVKEGGNVETVEPLLPAMD